MQVISHFSVIGVGDTLKPIESIKYSILTNIEVIYGPLPNEDVPLENEVWLQIAPELNLRALFNQNERPITALQMFELQSQDDVLKIPLQCDYQPCVIKKRFENSQSQFKGINNGHSLYSGQFDLSQILGYDVKKGVQLVLCFQRQSEINYTQPIVDLTLLTAKNNNKNPQLTLIITKDYSAVKFGFGTKKDLFLIYRQRVSPLKVSYTPQLLDRYPIDENDLIQMIPMFCFPSGVQLIKGNDDPLAIEQQVFNFILTSETGVRTYCTSLVFYERIPENLLQQLGHIEPDMYYHPIAICLLSSFNYPEQMKELAKYMYRCSLSKNIVPIEQTISDIITGLILPQDKDICVKLALPSNDLYFGVHSQFPLGSNESLECLFKLLDTSQIVSLYSAILLEKKIHLISNHPAVPGLIIDAFLQLLFPFDYTSLLISVLPESLQSYVEAPVPFMIGYSQKQMPNQHTQPDCIYVYLDTNYVTNIKAIPQLPEKLSKKILSDLKFHKFDETIAKQFLKRVDHAYQIFMHDSDYDPEADQLDCNAVRNAFYKLNMGLMKGYRKFLQFSEVQGEFSQCFRVKEYIEYHKKKEFIVALTETRMFQYFIQQRQEESQKDSYYKYFDSCLESKQKYYLKPPTLKEIPLSIYEEDSGQLYCYDKFPRLNPEGFRSYNRREVQMFQSYDEPKTNTNSLEK